MKPVLFIARALMNQKQEKNVLLLLFFFNFIFTFMLEYYLYQDLVNLMYIPFKWTALFKSCLKTFTQHFSFFFFLNSLLCQLHNCGILKKYIYNGTIMNMKYKSYNKSVPRKGKLFSVLSNFIAYLYISGVYIHIVKEAKAWCRNDL